MDMNLFKKNRLHHSLAAAAMLGTLFSSAGAQAATQGNIGSTSSGSISITATIANLVQITGLSDMSFTTVLTGSSPANITQNVCVWSNTLNRSYTIKATGTGTSSAFTLAAGTNPVVIPYSVSWAGTTGAPSGTALTANVTSGTFTGAAIAPACLAGPTTATLSVTIATADQGAMIGGSAYTGTLTLLVTPV